MKPVGDHLCSSLAMKILLGGISWGDHESLYFYTVLEEDNAIIFNFLCMRESWRFMMHLSYLFD